MVVARINLRRILYSTKYNRMLPGYEKDIYCFSSEVHSCQHLLSLGKQTGVQFPDGVYTINPDGKGPVNTYCDMTRDGGGWTLLVTSHTHTWTANNVKKRNQNQPTLNGDFSILYKADEIKNSLNVEGDWFEYCMEANERGTFVSVYVQHKKRRVEENRGENYSL